MNASIDDFMSWLLDEGPRQPNMRSVLQAVIERLREAGVPIDRVASNNPTLHPELIAYSLVWKEGDSFPSEIPIIHDVTQTDTYLLSPFRAIHDGAAGVRRRLDGETETLEFPMLEELRDEGYTDYAAMSLPFTSGRVGVVSWCTRRSGGFATDELAMLDAIRPVLAMLAEIHASRRVTQTLLDTYLGHEAGGRVLTGEIRRGSGNTIRSVLWISDLRGFTALSDRLPLANLIHVLNDYFEAIAAPVHAHGGEVLKLIGDAMLAIFRIDERSDVAEICDTALNAAELAIANMKRLNRRRGREDKPPLRFGLSLHVGDVMYGNVGAPTRLDFTVIGPAVNLAARLESLAGELGHELVTSADFAGYCPGRLVSIGRHGLKGIDEPQEAFVPA